MGNVVDLASRVLDWLFRVSGRLTVLGFAVRFLGVAAFGVAQALNWLKRHLRP
jgi:hypothetical protein